MKRFFLALCIITQFLTAQQTERVIEVQGIGELKTLPDIGNLNIEVSTVKIEFGEAVRTLNAKTDKLIAQLQTVGFKKEQIKTTDFSVNKNIVYRNGYAKDSGFVARQNVVAEFPNTKEKIASIINSFMNSTNDVSFTFSFALSDAKREQVKKEVIALAITNAKTRAEQIAAGAGVQLGAVQKILYGAPQQPPMFERSVSASMLKNDANNSYGFDVKELYFSDTITIIWKIQ